ncbi:MAG: hypothetical protein ACQKBV_04085 [Puniceicoccales bacterium]
MPSDHLPRAPKRQLPKWPFWLGDGLLVLTGIVLAFAQSGGELTPFAMAAVVTAIALGAILACAPYAIEHLAEIVKNKNGGDWSEVRNKVVKLEFRLAELELNGGSVPESARLAHSRWTEDEDDLGVGAVTTQPKSNPAAPAPAPAQAQPQREAPANPHFNFAAKGAALVGAKAGAAEDAPTAQELTPEARAKQIREELDLEAGPIDSETGVGPARPQKPKPASAQPEFKVVEDIAQDDEEEGNLPTSLDDLAPPEVGKTAHLRKALDHAKKHTSSRHVQRLIQGGKRSAG